jgi:CRISPR-associated protein Cas1
VSTQLLNTLFVLTQSAYAHLEGETVKVEADGKVLNQVPLHHIGAIVLMGNVLVSPFLLHRCAEDGRSVVWLTEGGRFKGRMEGPASGNVLLRRAQYDAQGSREYCTAIARWIVEGKVQNLRANLLRAAREHGDGDASALLTRAAEGLKERIAVLRGMTDLDSVRGIEGTTARTYFDAFDIMIRAQKDGFVFKGRSRRPPLDRVNAVLSFLYALLVNDCASAAQGVGLDPQVGFLHALRPGRPALALDLMEELRPVFVDRLALAMINLRQLQPIHFEDRPGGAVYLNEGGRKEVIVAYQKRKQTELRHAGLDRRVPLGLVPHVQARLLARYLRGDCKQYVPFVLR